MENKVLRTVYIDPWMDDAIRKERRETGVSSDLIIEKYLLLGMKISKEQLTKSQESK